MREIHTGLVDVTRSPKLGNGDGSVPGKEQDVPILEPHDESSRMSSV